MRWLSRATKGRGPRAFSWATRHPVVAGSRRPTGCEFRGAGARRQIVGGHSKQCSVDTRRRIRKVRPPEPYKGKGIRYRLLVRWA